MAMQIASRRAKCIDVRLVPQADEGRVDFRYAPNGTVVADRYRNARPFDRRLEPSQ